MPMIKQDVVDSLHHEANTAFFNVTKLSGDAVCDRDAREGAIHAIINVRKHLEEAGLKHSAAYLTEENTGG